MPDNGSYRLNFFTNQCYFFPRYSFSSTAAAPVLETWFYQNIPLFFFVYHSFLSYFAGDDLWYVYYSFGVRLG